MVYISVKPKKFPIGSVNVIHLAGNPFIILREKKNARFICTNGRLGSAIQLIFKFKYRYCIGESNCERPITG